MKTQSKITKQFPGTYAALCDLHTPRVIHDEIEYENTIEWIDALSGNSKLNKDQADYLETLTELVEAYEAQHHSIKTHSGVELLKYLMNENSLSKERLGKILHRDASLAYKILQGTRKLTLEHARLLGKHFSINPGAFV